MLLRDLESYIGPASDDREICVAVQSVETGNEIAATFDIVVDISEYGEVIISVMILTRGASPASMLKEARFLLNNYMDKERGDLHV